LYYVGDELTDILEIGDNLTTNDEDGNVEVVSFYVILRTKTLHKVESLLQINGEFF
jgi:hypothetical protein